MNRTILAANGSREYLRWITLANESVLRMLRGIFARVSHYPNFTFLLRVNYVSVTTRTQD